MGIKRAKLNFQFKNLLEKQRCFHIITIKRTSSLLQITTPFLVFRFLYLWWRPARHHYAVSQLHNMRSHKFCFWMKPFRLWLSVRKILRAVTSFSVDMHPCAPLHFPAISLYCVMATLTAFLSDCLRESIWLRTILRS